MREWVGKGVRGEAGEEVGLVKLGVTVVDKWVMLE